MLPTETREGIREWARTRPNSTLAYAFMLIATVGGAALWQAFFKGESMVAIQRKAMSGDRRAQYKLATSYEISWVKDYGKACMWRTVLSHSGQRDSAKWDQDHLKYACGKLSQAERRDATSKGVELIRTIGTKK